MIKPLIDNFIQSIYTDTGDENENLPSPLKTLLKLPIIQRMNNNEIQSSSCSLEPSFQNMYDKEPPSFIAGIIVASWIWGIVCATLIYVNQRLRLRLEENDYLLSTKIKDLRESIRVNLSTNSIVRRITNNGRWPWDRMHEIRQRKYSTDVIQEADEEVDDEDDLNSLLLSPEKVLLSSPISSPSSASIKKNNTPMRSPNKFPLIAKALNFTNNTTLNPFIVEEIPGVCIGSIFGLDVGGTLTKLVYFDVGENNMYQSARLSKRNLMNTSVLSSSVDDQELNTCNSIDSLDKSSHNDTLNSMDSRTSGVGLKKSYSSLDFTKRSRSHTDALKSFYNFANTLDAIGHSLREKHMSFYSRKLDGEFHFIHFETRHMGDAIDMIRANNLHSNITEIGATGGGAHKFSKDWEDTLGIKMIATEELASLVAGMQFVLSDGNVVGESYTFKPSSKNESENQEDKKEGKSQKNNTPPEDSWSSKVHYDEPLKSGSYPYLVVIIGTGVSILRVDGPGSHNFERISGSTIGGGTYFGLCRLLTDAEGFDDIMSLAERGDPTKVDMLVGDIYGKNSEALQKLGLPSSIVASSFGKLVTKENPAQGITQEDLARALLAMVTNNIGQVAYLNAQLHKTSRIYFVGNFLRHNNLSQRRLAYAIQYWSQNTIEALFLEHEGYYGALGAFLLSQNIPVTPSNQRKSSMRTSSIPIKKGANVQSFVKDSDHRRSMFRKQYSQKS
eukprot:CAMPEP_0178942920 /NCGR_PEP_ID=MMETSP0789-20121207/2276_1 /TAXON_ID=3005 /ORGANISM="Rhizosolenia setigera, Strain CCMP 1694" /LENGTH=727 /DNA_ID=CAMNT_0020622411 /DNA_START=155 /DNA_END=2338 /DNA_ORIENTATION=+